MPRQDVRTRVWKIPSGGGRSRRLRRHALMGAGSMKRALMVIVLGCVLTGMMLIPTASASFFGDQGLLAYVIPVGNSEMELRVSPTAGGEPRTIFQGRLGAPAWAPDGRRLLLALTRPSRIVVLRPDGKELG